MGGKYSVCEFCDDNCIVKVIEENGEFKLRPFDPQIPAICRKILIWDEYRHHEGRITKPLKNVGRRGEPVWIELSWTEALDEIAERLSSVIQAYGAESIGVSGMPLNHGFGGITRRLMNCIGTPNYIAPVELCMGNTAQVHRSTYGWYTTPNWDKADLIVYFGQDRSPEKWPEEYLKLKAALGRGAKLIHVDPRTTQTAQLADYHLKLRYGTDAALTLAWLHIIIAEKLYDHEFVEAMTIGFDDLKERVAEYSPEWAAGVCGIDAELIRLTARLYASAEAAIIPWGVTGDMQRNSTSMLRCQCNTNLHQIERLRKRKPDPRVLISPVDSQKQGIVEGEWVDVSTTTGSLRLLAHIDDAQPAGTLRIPHGWWKPETPNGLGAGLSCAAIHNDGMLFDDADWNLDPEQGLANLRGGIRARISLVGC